MNRAGKGRGFSQEWPCRFCSRSTLQACPYIDGVLARSLHLQPTLSFFPVALEMIVHVECVSLKHRLQRYLTLKHMTLRTTINTLVDDRGIRKIQNDRCPPRLSPYELLLSVHIHSRPLVTSRCRRFVSRGASPTSYLRRVEMETLLRASRDPPHPPSPPRPQSPLARVELEAAPA